jgi:putative hydrolase of the HAD superfamily
MPRFELLAFDADDTLWQNESLYAEVQAKFAALLAKYHPEDLIRERLYQAETRNLEHFGYGVKAFALSMIETAVELTEGQISGRDLQSLVDLAKGMLQGNLDLLDDAEETLNLLKVKYPLMLLTKGDLFEQEGKVARSGLSGCFRHIEILSQKTIPVYRSLLDRYAMDPERFLMVGNSLRSDILPVLEIGGHAVFIPHPLTWQHEHGDPPSVGHPGYYQLERLGQLPALLEQIENQLSFRP